MVDLASSGKCLRPTLTIRYTLGASAVGLIVLAATEEGICALSLADTEEELLQFLRDEFPKATLIRADADLAGWLQQVNQFLESGHAEPSLPLAAQGTAFQQRVWAELRRIPRGETRTYSDVALAIGQPKAVRAVARACALNPVSLLTPCHRVIGRDGHMRGYRWGTERKVRLITAEKGTPLARCAEGTVPEGVELA